MLTSHNAPTVYRLRAGTREDSDGDEVLDWTTATRTVIRRAEVQPVLSRDADGAVIRIDSERHLLIRGPRPDLTATDRVVYEGDTWRIDGEPLTTAGYSIGTTTSARLKRIERRAR